MMAFPAAAAVRLPPANVAADDILTRVLLYTPLLSTTLLAKLSVPPFATQGLSIAYLFIFLAMGLGVVLGRLQLDIGRLNFFLLFMGGIGALQVVRGDPFSVTSLLLLGMLHLSYVFCLPGRRDWTGQASAFFLELATLLALVGIGQYVLQFALGPHYAFPIESFVPGDFLVQGFHMQAPVAYGLAAYRTNGLFFAEPSFFSQFMAVAIVIELLTSNRLLRVALYGLALLLSYSGTGILVLLVCGPLLLLTRRRGGVLGLALVGLVLLALLGSMLDLDKLTGRIAEFGAMRSSAYARFVGGFHLFDQYLWPYPVKALFGYGAGEFPVYAGRLSFPVAEMTLFKMVFEYGLLGSAFYFCFIAYCVFRSRAPAIACLAVALTLLLNGPFVPFFHGLALSLLVWSSGAPEPEPGLSAVKPFIARGA